MVTPVFLKRNVKNGIGMIREYLTSTNLRTVVSLVDMRHEPSADDIQMYEFLKYYEIPVILVATKADDKIPRSKWNKHEYDQEPSGSIVRTTLSFFQVLIKLV